MKFSNVLFFASFALAVPTVEVRQQTVAGTVVAAVDTLVDVTQSNVQAIEDAVEGITDNVEAEVEARVRANLENILEAFQAATATIVDATVNGAGGLIGAATGLTQQQINQVTEAVRGAIDALEEIRVIVDAEVSDLPASLVVLVDEEIDAIAQAINPFVRPLVVFARAVQTFSARVGVTVIGLRTATNQLVATATTYLDSIGLELILPFIGQQAKRSLL